MSVPPVAIVTGAASGIGRALAAALVARGASVVLADVDAGRVTRAAARADADAPGRADGVELDVRDPDAVRDLVHRVRRVHDRLDLMVNNAGVGVGGATDELDLDHWEHAIDVNLRGVIHGIDAAYPIMVAQGDGHIVNTASLLGLIPAPLLVPYVATKHAVVGLSLSLRLEAADRGVRVSCVCPGAVDTPILDGDGPADLAVPPSAATVDTRALLTRAAGRPIAPEDAAARILRGIARDDALIVFPRRARLGWRLQRLAPGLLGRHLRRLFGHDRRAGS